MEKMTLTQLKNEIALKIRDDKLNNFLSLDDVTNKVIKKIQESGGFKDLIPELENPVVAKPANSFPQEEELEDTINAQKKPTREKEPPVPMSLPPQAPVQQAPEPATTYTPELPDMIKNVEAGKIIVFDYTELDEPGENLAIKPFRTYDDPDVKKSIKDMWLTDAQRGAEVYVAKFEKIGDLTFDYINGVARFEETPAEPVEAAETMIDDYKDNPYKTEPTPQMMQTAVDVEKIAEKVIMDLLRKSLGVSQDGGANIPGEVEQAMFSNDHTVGIPELGIDANTPISDVQLPVKSDDTIMSHIANHLPKRADNQERQPEDTRITDGHDSPEELGFVVKEGVNLNDLVNIKSEFKKVSTPKQILEALDGKNKEIKLIQETKEVKGWELDGVEYYLPTNHLSTKKCYIKN